MTHQSRKARDWILRAGLLVLSFSLAGVISEILIRWWTPMDLSGSWRVQTPDGMIMNKSSGRAQHVLGERQVTYEFSPPGLRRSGSLDASHRVLVLGDSFTFGWLLSDADSVVGGLERRTDLRFGPNVVGYANAACGGWGLDEMVGYAESFGDQVAPELVLVFLNTDDVGRCLKSPHYQMVTPGGMTLSKTTIPVSRARALAQSFPGYQYLLEHSHLVQRMRHIAIWGIEWPEEEEDEIAPGIPWHLYRGPKSNFLEDPSPAVQLAQALFLRLYDWCRQRTVPLVVFTTGWHCVTDGPPSREPTEAFMESAAIFFEQNGIPFVDLTSEIRPIIDAEPAGFLLPENPHPNERGAALIVEHAWPRLQPYLESLTEN